MNEKSFKIKTFKYRFVTLKKGESKNQRMILQELGKKVEKYRNEGYILPEDLEKILK